MTVAQRNRTADAIIERLLYGRSKLVLSKTRITAIERAFRACNTFSEFSAKYSDQAHDLTKIQSGFLEVQKQFENRQKLQPGILMECVGVSTVANLFGMDVVYSSAGKNFDELPTNIQGHLLVDKQDRKILPRYIFNNNSTGDFLLQYGAPGTCDAVACINGVACSIELKDSVARGGERDLTYDGRGKLIVGADVLREYPQYRKYIDRFNSTTNMLTQIQTGRNYPLGDHHTLINSFKTYLETSGVDLILIVSRGKLIPILTADVVATTSDGTPILSTNGSEIRPAGRNNKQVFVPNLLNETLRKLDAKIVGECCEIDISKLPNKLGWKNGRSGATKTRLKLSRVLFVRTANVEQRGNTVRFKRSDVLQSTCTISSHVRVNCGIDDLRTLYPLNVLAQEN